MEVKYRAARSFKTKTKTSLHCVLLPFLTYTGTSRSCLPTLRNSICVHRWWRPNLRISGEAGCHSHLETKASNPKSDLLFLQGRRPCPSVSDSNDGGSRSSSNNKSNHNHNSIITTAIVTAATSTAAQQQQEKQKWVESVAVVALVVTLKVSQASTLIRRSRRHKAANLRSL